MTYEEMIEAMKAIVAEINKTNTMSAEFFEEDCTAGSPIPFVISGPFGSFAANIEGPL